MVLIFSIPSSRASWSNSEKTPFSRSTSRAGDSAAASSVKPTRSANRMVASSTRSAIRTSPLFSRATIVARQDVVQQRFGAASFSALSSARYWRSRSRQRLRSRQATIRARSSTGSNGFGR